MKQKKATIVISMQLIVIIIIALALLVAFIIAQKNVSKSMTKFEDISSEYFANPPNAIIASPFNESTFYANEEINFDGSYSYDTQKKIKGYFWEINGDGKVDSKDKIAKYSYQEPGRYIVRLKVMNEQGAVSETSVEIEILSTNSKNISKYVNNPLFLMSNINTNELLQVIPLTIWIDRGNLTEYPYMIYEGTNNQNDIINMMNKFNKKYAINFGNTINGDGAHIITTQNIADDYFSYWSTYDTVVITYTANPNKLIIALFAAYINAPLVFIDRIEDKVLTKLQNRKIYMIDQDQINLEIRANLSKNPIKRYNSSQLYNQTINRFVGINSTAMMVS